jgi:hypothetical protein
LREGLRVRRRGAEGEHVSETDQNRYRDALAVEFEHEAMGDTTVRRYLTALLSAVWGQGEGFSGKKPFGNSGWEFDLYGPLMDSGFIEWVAPYPHNPGYLQLKDERAAHLFVADLILAMCADEKARR